MVFHRSRGDRRDGAVRGPRRLDRPLAVELAAAGALRLPADHVLAGARPPGVVPDSLRRIRPRRPASRAQPDVAGRARTVPSADARAFRLQRAARELRSPVILSEAKNLE